MNEPDLPTLIKYLHRHLGERLDAVVLFGSRTYWECLARQMAESLQEDDDEA